MPTLIVLVGLPGSGKSTSVNDLFEDLNSSDTFYYSTDAYIDRVALSKGMTYNECFKDHINEATKEMNSSLNDAIRWNSNVIWDQTNMSSKKRLGILSKFPKSYRKICICRVPPQTADEWLELGIRLGSRPGKIIPMNIIESMADSYVEPTLDEGFDEVHLYDIYGNML